VARLSLAVTKEARAKYAKTLLEDELVEVLMREGRPLRTPELIQRASNGINLSREYLRQEFADGSRLVFAERKWDIASRREGKERSVEGLIAESLKVAGRPLDSEKLARELTAARGGVERSYLRMVPRLLRDRSKYVEIHGEVYILDQWLLDVTTQNEEEIIIENFLHKDPDFEDVREKLSGRRFTTSGRPADWIVRILESVGRPLHHRLISFLIWKEQQRHFDPVSVWCAIHDDDRLHVLSSGHVLTTEMKRELEKEIARTVASVATKAAEEIVVDVGSLLKKKVPKSQTVTLGDEDLHEISAYFNEVGRPASLPELMNYVFDLSPTDEEYVATLQALSAALEKSDDYANVGAFQFCPTTLIPAEIHEVPALLQIERVVVQNEAGEDVDILLEDGGLDGDLAKLVAAAEWEECGEEFDVARVPKTRKSREEVVYAVPYRHHVCGTMKYRELDDEFFGVETGLMFATFVHEELGEIPVWISEENGLITGLREFYQRFLEPCGSVIRLRPTDKPGRFTISVSGREELLYVPPERVEQLRAMAEEAAAKPMSVFEIICRIMAQHEGGMEFITLWSEVNIVRRTCKRLIASILSGYHCFRLVEGASKSFFLFDESRVEEGFNGRKRRYIMEEDMY